MDALLPAAREKVNAELGARFAELCQQHEFFYILGSGPNFSQTYAMAICSLMEMQWQHCCYIHSGEYFHGPFEATEPGVFYFVQLGAGECRPMEERALAFLNTHTDTIMVLDALEYGVGDVPASVRSFRLVSRLDSRCCGSQRPTLRRKPRRPTSRAGRCCRGCAGSSCGSPRVRTQTGRACRPPRRPRRRSRTAGRCRCPPRHTGRS